MPSTPNEATIGASDIQFIATATGVANKLLTRQTPCDPQDLRRAHQALTDAVTHLAQLIVPDEEARPMITCYQCYLNYQADHNEDQYELCMSKCTG